MAATYAIMLPTAHLTSDRYTDLAAAIADCDARRASGAEVVVVVLPSRTSVYPAHTFPEPVRV